jgi:hypothetical protein
MTEPDRPGQGLPPDELAAISALLTEPLPAPGVVEAARQRLAQVSTGRAADPRPGPPGPARPARWAARPGRARGPRWLAPSAAAAAVAVVLAGSLLVARTVRNQPGGTAAPGRGAAAFAQVPPYFVMIGQEVPGPALVSATATGAVLGSVPVPRWARQFTMAAAAGNGRDFVLAASRGPLDEPVTRFYRLLLSTSGHPGPLIPLPIATQPRQLSGLALSRDGRQLAVALGPSGSRRASGVIKIYSLATGAERDWAWPGASWAGDASTQPGLVDESAARYLSWTADGSRLLFRINTGHGRNRSAQIRLLDTTAPGSNLRTSSQLIHIPASELGPYGSPAPVSVPGPLLITGDGTRAMGATARVLQRPRQARDTGPAPVLDSTITGFPVGAGQPVRIALRQTLAHDAGPEVLWVNQAGTAMIIFRPAAKLAPGIDGALGALTPDGFTPFPAAVQRFYPAYQPDW